MQYEYQWFLKLKGKELGMVLTGDFSSFEKGRDLFFLLLLIEAAYKLSSGF